MQLFFDLNTFYQYTNNDETKPFCIQNSRKLHILNVDHVYNHNFEAI